MVTFKTGGEAPYVDEGWYTAKLTELEERESTNPAFPGVRVIWHFQLTDENGSVVENDGGMPLDFWEFTSQSVGPKSNARPIVEALLGAAIGDMSGDDIQDAVIGKSCQVKIADSFKENGDFGGSRTVKGSWKPVGASRPAAGRPAARQPVAAGAPKDEVPF